MEQLSPTQIESILYDVVPDDCDLAGETHVASVAATSARGDVSRGRGMAHITFLKTSAPLEKKAKEKSTLV